MTERLHFHFSLSCIGEGNGNPLQCSCLENPRDCVLVSFGISDFLEEISTAATAKSLQSCLTLCDPMDYGPPGSSVHGISQTRILAAAAAKSLQSCPTLCDPIDGSTPGSTVPGILQARTLEWVAISFSNA